MKYVWSRIEYGLFWHASIYENGTSKQVSDCTLVYNKANKKKQQFGGEF
jgi:hypothetical protein